MEAIWKVTTVIGLTCCLGLFAAVSADRADAADRPSGDAPALQKAQTLLDAGTTLQGQKEAAEGKVDSEAGPSRTAQAHDPDAGNCGSGGDCCTSNSPNPGCDDADCCHCICACDPFCCDTAWDSSCADQGFDSDCGASNPNSGCADECSECLEGPGDCIKDVVITVDCGQAANVQGTTVGAGNDSTCRDSEDLIITVNILTGGIYNFDMTTSQDPCLWDGYMYLTSGDACTCTDVVAFNDDCPSGGGCFGTSCIIGVPLDPGEYWIVLEGFGAGDAGPVNLDITSECFEECVKDVEIAVDCGESVNVQGTTVGAGNDSLCRDSEDMIISVDILSAGIYNFDMTTSQDPCLWDGYMLLVADDGCLCGDVVAFNDDCPSGGGCFGTSCIIGLFLDPGKYWIVLEGFGAGDAGPVNLDITSECIGECEKDVVLDVECGRSANVQGTTVGAGNDSLCRDSEDMIITVNILSEGTYNFDMTTSQDPCLWDGYMLLVAPDPCLCEEVIAFNDDCPSGGGCFGTSCIIGVDLLPGEYWIVLEGFGAGDAGPVNLDITSNCAANCGDGICDPAAGEDECNCPQDCDGECVCFIFNNKAEFEAFNEEEGKDLKGIEDFEEGTLGPDGIAGLFDPLCGGIPSTPDGTPYPEGLTQLNMCVQANILGGAPVDPAPHSPAFPGQNGLAAASADFAGFGITSDIVIANYFVDSYDIMLTSPPALEEDDHTGVGFNTISLLGSGAVDILVYNKANEQIASSSSPADVGGSEFWGVWCSDPIGRVNIFDAGAGAEGGDNIQLWIDGGCQPGGDDCPEKCEECDEESGECVPIPDCCESQADCNGCEDCDLATNTCFDDQSKCPGCQDCVDAQCVDDQDKCPGCQDCVDAECVDDQDKCAGCQDCVDAECVDDDDKCDDGDACTEDTCVNGDCESTSQEQTLIIKQGASGQGPECHAPVNANSNGVLPVLLVGTDTFTAAGVDLNSLDLHLCGDGPSGVGPIASHTKFKDLNHPTDLPVGCPGCQCNDDESSDGIDDLSMKFSVSDLVSTLGLTAGTYTLELTGTWGMNDEPFCARDCIIVVPPGAGTMNATMESNVSDTLLEVTPMDLNFDIDGFANFSRAYVEGTMVTLTAPSLSEGRRFLRWSVNGEMQGFGIRRIDVTITADTALKAFYQRPGRVVPKLPTEGSGDMD